VRNTIVSGRAKCADPICHCFCVPSRDAASSEGWRRTALSTLRSVASGVCAARTGHTGHDRDAVLAVSRRPLLRWIAWRHGAVRDAAARWSPTRARLYWTDRRVEEPGQTLDVSAPPQLVRRTEGDSYTALTGMNEPDGFAVYEGHTPNYRDRA